MGFEDKIFCVEASIDKVKEKLFKQKDSHNTELQVKELEIRRRINKIKRGQLQALADVRSEVRQKVRFEMKKELEEQTSTLRKKVQDLLAENQCLKNRCEDRRLSGDELEERPEGLANGIKAVT